MGPEKFYQALLSFGCVEPNNLGILKPVKQWDDMYVSRLAIGQGFYVTPMQICKAYCKFSKFIYWQTHEMLAARNLKVDGRDILGSSCTSQKWDKTKYSYTKFYSGFIGFIAGNSGYIVIDGAAGVVQTSSVLVRGTSTATTGGAGNPVVSTLELIASIAGTILSIVLPVLTIMVIAFMAFIIIRRFMRKRKKLVEVI